MSVDVQPQGADIFSLDLTDTTVADRVGGGVDEVDVTSSSKSKAVPICPAPERRSAVSLGSAPRQLYHQHMHGLSSSPIVTRNISKRSRSISISADHHRILNGLKGSSHGVLFRRSDGTPVLKSLASLSLDEDSIMEGNEHFEQFFKWYKCYDLIPTSAKLVVLDTRLIVKKAFYAMVDTGVRACTLWDSKLQQFVGMLTITDFIRILQNNYKGQGEAMSAFEEQRLCDVKGVTTEEPSDVYHMYPDSTLYDAAMMLLEKKIHRLPIIDPANGNVLSILTQKPLVKFLYTFFPNLENVEVLKKSIRVANVGTFHDIKTATWDMTILDALNIFVEDRISALPIVDAEGKLINIYSKFDVINLAAEKTYTYLDVSLKEATSHKTGWFSGVHSCNSDESVFTVMERLVQTDVARLVVTDQEQKVAGIVTVSDIIFYLMFHDDDAVEAAAVEGKNIRNCLSFSRNSLGSSFRSGSNNSMLGTSGSKVSLASSYNANFLDTYSNSKSLSSSYSPPSVFNV